MKPITVLIAALVVLSWSAPSRAQQPGPMPTPYPQHSPGAADPAQTGTSAPRTPAQPTNDNAMGAGTTTGTVHPNTTGSSGSSGTSGVDASTGNSH